MTAQKFDEITRILGKGSTRRLLVPRALAGAIGLGAFVTAAGKGHACRGAAAICNGNATCCGNLQCMPTGIGNQHRCLEPLPPPPTPE